VNEGREQENSKMEPVALFVLENSHYKGRLPDCYDENRNALTYAGTNPVIAHPPCQLWGENGYY